MIQVLIDSDKQYIATCCWIYGAVLVVSIVLTVCLSAFVWKNNTLISLSGLLANGLVFPLVPKHLQRMRALRIINGLKQECSRHAPDDPQCKRIADNVDSMLRATGAV
jgi:hypothetical protein